MSLRSSLSTVAKVASRTGTPDDQSEPHKLTGALAALCSVHRDKLLEVVAIAAKELLRSTDLDASLLKVMELIGTAAGVDRAHVFLFDQTRSDGQLREHHIWTLPGIATPPQFKNSKSPMADVGLGSWISTLKRGEAIASHISDLDPAARGFLEIGGVKSTLCVPIFADGDWLGMIAFDDCSNERDWSATEIDTVKTLAELVGAAIASTTRSEQLANANRIIENSPTIIYRVSPQYPYPLTYLSQNVSRYGYRADDLLAHPERWAQLIETADFPRVLANMKALSAGEEHTQNLQFRMRKADGSIVCFESRSSVLRDGENRIVALEGLLSDVTERKRTETELSFTHSLLTTAIEGSPDAVLVVDANGRIIMFNRHFVELWNIPEEIVQAGSDEPVLKGVSSQIKNESEFVARVRYLYSHPEIQSDEEIETKDGRFIERHSGSLHDPQQKYLGRVWFFRDISEKKRAVDKIAALARTDALTGLPNRTAFLERLSLEFARAKRGANQFAVHYLDLDHFKDVNDTLGHPVGDKLLQAVAARLKDCVRETDMVARFGGDEFAVLQDDISDSSSVEALAAKLGETIAIPYTIEDSQVQTTVSIGIVPFRGDVAGVDAMMMKADLALYRAKNEGRNQFRFHVLELDEQTRERMIIGEELRHAIKRNELELFYQPQVDIKSGCIVGMEALIRWNHPKRGMILPASFIPIAETTGSIVPIGEWVIEHACEQISAWNALGIAPTTVAVNLSGAQFKLASQLDKVVTDNLARYNIAPRQIELELTESVLIETTQRHADVFNRLRKIGVRLAIDDFGTGYSSLDYLRLFRVSRLKIDRRFIADVVTSADDAAIVRATVGLANELGIEVVAEGVETAGQRDFLIAASCKVAQGYLFGLPMPAAAAGELLRHNPAAPPAPLKAAPGPIVRPRVPAAAAPMRRNSAAGRAPR